MVDRLAQTIVAPITAVGGAVAVVRVCGPAAYRVAAAVFTPWPTVVEARRAVYGAFSHGDDGLVLPFSAGSSYTGEETVEMSVHGSAASVAALVEACCQAGARMAEPGEFTLRAFLNGRLDLTQAEGVRALVEAQSQSALRQGRLLREGRLSQMCVALRHEVLGQLAAVEASTDFGEEVGELDREGLANRILESVGRIEDLLATAQASRLAHTGMSVVLAGRPNAGKSSLFNALLQADRAIVTPVPGTTRDTLHESVQISGVLVRLIDTAGLRESDDLVEAIGVSRTRETVADADLVLYIYDASLGLTSEDAATFAAIGRPKQLIANKCDLEHVAGPGLPVSAATGQGVSTVIELIAAHAGSAAGEQPFVLPRHVPLLEQAQRALMEVVATLRSPVPDDLAAVGLRSAARALGEVTGETATPDVVDRIFHDFCIGK
ncbi:MAG: tRNA uridine-5-carboxymethylaminomethyl(34) synthesis GTPase MnmE [Armatimonadetes bacterium]|nr:tRNA uridine-5-carboxymethylaminomethyl(34) synthesis GTPase MnmE [Armatimonadota bacterium]